MQKQTKKKIFKINIKFIILILKMRRKMEKVSTLMKNMMIQIKMSLNKRKMKLAQKKKKRKNLKTINVLFPWKIINFAIKNTVVKLHCTLILLMYMISKNNIGLTLSILKIMHKLSKVLKGDQEINNKTRIIVRKKKNNLMMLIKKKWKII